MHHPLEHREEARACSTCLVRQSIDLLQHWRQITRIDPSSKMSAMRTHLRTFQGGWSRTRCLPFQSKVAHTSCRQHGFTSRVKTKHLSEQRERESTKGCRTWRRAPSWLSSRETLEHELCTEGFPQPTRQLVRVRVRTSRWQMRS